MIPKTNSLFQRSNAVLLLCSLVLNLFIPAFGQERSVPQGRPIPLDVSPVPSGTVPEMFTQPWVAPAPVKSDASLKVRPAAALQRAKFSKLADVPSEAEVGRGRVFSLFPNIARKGMSDEKSRRLASRFANSRGNNTATGIGKTLEILNEGLKGRGEDSFKFALLGEKAKLEWESGWFTKAVESWESAWAMKGLFKEKGDLDEAQAVYASLLQAHMSLGNRARLEELIAQGMEDTTLGGAAYEALSDARATLWHLRNRAEQNVFCGFNALNTVCIPLGQNPAHPDVHDEEEKARFIKEGLSVFELVAHSAEAGGKVAAYRKQAGDEYVVPSVLHWNFGHYSALTKKRGNEYYIEDTDLNYCGWVSKEALDAQTTGVLVIPDGIAVPKSFARLTDEEMKSFFGRHCTHAVGDEGPPPPPCKDDDCVKGMAAYNFSSLEPGLLLDDIPLSHASPFGPDMDFGVHYFQRRNGSGRSPLALDVGGMGPMWSHSYNTFILLRGNQEGGSTAESIVNWVQASGHYIKYKNPTGGVYQKGYESNPTLTRTYGAEGVGGYFTLDYPDGSKWKFDQVDSAAPGKYYLGEIQDPFGNKLTLSYDSPMLLTGITNDAGQSLTIGYEAETGDNVGFTNSAYRIRSVTDPFGRVAKFKYNSQGRLWKSIDTMGIVSEFTYGNNDFVKSLTTPYGVTNFESGFIPDSIGVSSNDASTAYLANTGRFIKATDALGNIEYAEAFEKDGLLPRNETGMLALQGNNAEATVQIPVAGQNVSFIPKNDYLYYRNTFYWDKNAWYNGPRDYTKARIFNWLADSEGKISGVLGSIKDPLVGRVWYNYKGQTSSSSPGTGSDTPSKTVRQVETTPGNTAWVIDQIEQNGPFARPSRLIDTLGREISIVYSGLDVTEIKVKTSPGVYTALMTLSDYVNHLPQTITETGGVVRTITYNDRGQPLTVTAQKGGNIEKSEYIYRRLDGSTTNEGYLTEVRRTHPDNASLMIPVVTLTYDSARRVRTETGTDGYTLTYDYDNLDRLTIITHPDSTTELYQYDKLDLSITKNRNGEWNRTIHDKIRRPAFSQDAAGRVTSYQWCLCGQIRQLVDPRGSVTRWVRDVQGRVIEKIGADGSKTSFSYQPLSGRLAALTKPKDQGSGHPTVTLGYDPDGNRSTVDYYDTATSDISLAYKDSGGTPDPLGRLLSWTDSIGTTSFSFVPFGTTNGAGQIHTENGPYANDTLRRGYDWRGRRNLTEVCDDASTVIYSDSDSIDSLGRLRQMVNDLGTTEVRYGATNFTQKPSSLFSPNGTSVNYQWYGADQGANALGLKSIISDHGLKLDYGYDLAGRITSWDRKHLASPVQKWELAYSREGEQTGIVEKDATGQVTNRTSWNYDPAGNWYARGGASATSTRTHDGMNRLSQIGGAGKTVVEGVLNEAGSVSVNGQPAAVTSIPGTAELKFQREIDVTQGTNNFDVTATDMNGNKRAQSYSVTVGGLVKSYEYDANGNMICEKGPSGETLRSFEWDSADRLKAVTSGSERIEWVYNAVGQKVLESRNGSPFRRFQWDGLRLLLERGADGTPNKKFYGSGESQKNGTSWTDFFYTRDHLGSIWEISNTDGNTKVRYEYDAYGNRTELAGRSEYVGDCNFGFTGHLTVNGFGSDGGQLVLTHFRAYDPALGRWLNPDPYGESVNAGGNLYLYGPNSPANGYDRDGGIWSIVVTLGFQAWDTYQHKQGNISNEEYALRSAVNLASLAADVATGGMGGGLAVRGAGGAIRVAIVAQRLSKADHLARAALVGANFALHNRGGGDDCDEGHPTPGERASNGRKGAKNDSQSTMGNNDRENKQYLDALKALGLKQHTPKAERLHRAISKKGYDYHGIIRVGREMGF